jgi:hypothetical protein
VKLWLFLYQLFFFFLRIGFADRYVCIAPFFLEAAAEVVVAAVYGAGSAFACHKIVAVFGFDFITADIAANGVFDNQ